LLLAATIQFNFQKLDQARQNAAHAHEMIQGFAYEEWCTGGEGLKARDVIAWVEGAAATEAQVGVQNHSGL
jgi:hypothetical protein